MRNVAACSWFVQRLEGMNEGLGFRIYCNPSEARKKLGLIFFFSCWVVECLLFFVDMVMAEINQTVRRFGLWHVGEFQNFSSSSSS